MSGDYEITLLSGDLLTVNDVFNLLKDAVFSEIIKPDEIIQILYGKTEPIQRRYIKKIFNFVVEKIGLKNIPSEVKKEINALLIDALKICYDELILKGVRTLSSQVKEIDEKVSRIPDENKLRKILSDYTTSQSQSFSDVLIIYAEQNEDSVQEIIHYLNENRVSSTISKWMFSEQIGWHMERDLPYTHFGSYTIVLGEKDCYDCFLDATLSVVEHVLKDKESILIPILLPTFHTKCFHWILGERVSIRLKNTLPDEGELERLRYGILSKSPGPPRKEHECAISGIATYHERAMISKDVRDQMHIKILDEAWTRRGL